MAMDRRLATRANVHFCPVLRGQQPSTGGLEAADFRVDVRPALPRAATLPRGEEDWKQRIEGGLSC